jgi:dipeptidyl aminopeptidase/acylaminoacyl peptidase
MIATLPGDGSLRDLMPDYDVHLSSFSWQSNNTLVWIADDRQTTTIGSVNLNAENKVIRGAHEAVFGNLTTSADGQTTSFVGHHPRHPSEVFFLGPNNATPKKLTDSNPWLKDMRFAKQEVVRWQRATV